LLLSKAAILGFLVEREFTTLTETNVQVTSDDHMLALPLREQGIGHNMHRSGAGNKPQRLGTGARRGA
jgi:hypothetical protein